MLFEISKIGASIGLFLLIVSMIIHISETKDFSILKKFWAKDNELVPSARVVNKVGFGIVVAFLGLMLVQILMLLL